MKRLLLFLFLITAARAQNTAKFPGAVPTTADLGVASNRAETTLTSGINAAATSIPVASSSGFKAGSFVTIDNEIIAVCSIPDGNHLNAGVSSCPNVDGRGIDTANGGGAAASHSAGTKVQGRITAKNINQAAAEIRAIATKLRGELLSIVDVGAVGDGSTDDTAAFLAALALVKATGAGLRIPAGTYLLNNSAGPLVVDAFSGSIYAEAGAVLSFSSLSHSGLRFTNASGVVLRGLRLRYRDTWVTQLPSDYTLWFSNGSNIAVNNLEIDNAPGMGAYFFECTKVDVSGARVSNTGKDGIHIANTTYAHVVNYYALNTGDDSLSFVDYGPGGINGGYHTASNLTIKNSHARGIAVVGPSNVTVSNFVIDGTSAQGLIVGEDTWTAGHVPQNVVISNGLILNAGGYSTPTTPDPWGVYVLMSSATGTLSAQFHNITVRNSGKDGFRIDQYGNDLDITLNGVWVDSPAVGNGITFLGKSIAKVFNTRVDNAPGYGAYFVGTSALVSNLTVKNAAGGGGVSGRAVWFDSITGNVSATGITVVDDRNPAIGYVVGDSGVTRGLATGVSFDLPHGTPSLTNGSAAMLWQYTGPTTFFANTQGNNLLSIQKKGILTATLKVGAGSDVDNTAVQLGPESGESATGSALCSNDNAGTRTCPVLLTKTKHLLVGSAVDDTWSNASMKLGGGLMVGTATWANLQNPSNAHVIYCSDCQVNATCALGGGTGAWAFRSAGGWKCPF